MTASSLEQAIEDVRAIRTVNFFNGRLLTGEDLAREQDANRRGRMRLGRAVGDGVAFGLEVTGARGGDAVGPVVHVEPGVAVNREGGALELSGPVDIALARSDDGDPEGGEVLFAQCEPIDPGAYTAGAGAYLLTIGPAETREGLAPVSGLGNGPSECNTAYRVETVQFRLLRMALTIDDMSHLDRLRNRLAHLMYGSYDPRPRAFGEDPFGPTLSTYGLLDALRDDCLTDEEVPLATLLWTAEDGLRFVDRWSVRRRLTRGPASERWPGLVGDRRMAEAEAMLLQFEDQVEDMRFEPGAGELPASRSFERLPPVGLLPVAGNGSANGFDPKTFFGNQASRDVATTDARLLRELVHDSLLHEPILVDGQERIQLYRIWDNVQAVAGGRASQLALVFAKGSLRYRGVARYGHAHYDVSRFAPSTI